MKNKNKYLRIKYNRVKTFIFSCRDSQKDELSHICSAAHA